MSKRLTSESSSVRSPGLSPLVDYHTPGHLAGKPPDRRWGILTKRERWGLAWQGWLALVLASILLGIFFLVTIQPFLTPTHRVNTRVLVVEGWVHDYVIRAAVEEFANGAYERVFATGGPTMGSGEYVRDAGTSASVGAGDLRAAGIPSSLVQMVPSHVIGRDRTYYSAVALRNWFREHDMKAGSLNIVAEDTHARRTWYLFQKALGDKVKVGIIAVHDPDYDGKHWWKSSDGFRGVTTEALAYFYARFLFNPPEEYGGWKSK